MGYTPEQEKCITQFVGPVDVSAGAGSGKTFTLTQRIAHALESPTSGVDDIDQVLAITFTKKAAAELKGRVRSTLQAKGMFEQARKVDSAWISTIHGMCSRILRSCALEIGIDPGFIAVENSQDMLNEAIEEVLEENRENAYQNYRLLFNTYQATCVSTSPFVGESVVDLVRKLLEEVYALPQGFDSLHLIASREQLSVLMRQLVLVYEQSIALMQEANEGATQAKNIQGCTQALGVIMALIGGNEEVTSAQVLAVVPTLYRLNANCGKSQKEAAKELQTRFDELIVRLVACHTAQVFDQLVALAREVDKRFAAKKRACSVLDFSDLVRLTLQALDNPQVKAQYENKFRLVMVDEFQDTDALQLAIVSKLSGAGLRYLCTVGDAQQSIYRFRGADVALYRSYQKDMFNASVVAAGGSPCTLQLTRNFRSHGDILAFVKKVCAQQSVFGQAFLDLQAVYDGAGYHASDPRIYMDVTLLHQGKREEVGAGADAYVMQANHIAAFFARMQQAGHDLSEMVLLLGRTTNAATYARVLREAGFDCVISGGSLFAKSEEARFMVNICRALVNTHDTTAVLNVLAGPLFQLNSSELLSLTTDADATLQQQQVMCSLDQGLQYCLENPEAFSPAVAHAASMFCEAQEQLRTQPLSQVVLRVLWQTGYFARLQKQGAQGSASIGNYLKALRLIQGIEEEGGTGPVQTCLRYKRMIDDGIKATPGALNVHDQQAIRIMTIHASKGLEFPIVALADFMKDSRSKNLLIARVQGKSYVTLFSKSVKIGSTSYGKSKQITLVGEQQQISDRTLESSDVLAAQVALDQCAHADEAAEEQRLFYVGATRAKEALGIFITAQESDNVQAMYPRIHGNVVQALFASGVVPVGESVVEYGGSAPARVECHYFEPADGCEGLNAGIDAGVDAGEGTPEGIAQNGDEQDASSLLARFWFNTPFAPSTNIVLNTHQPSTNVVSYSSLAQGAAPFTLLQSAECVTTSEYDNQEDAFASEQAVSADEDKATDFGSALHRLCQLSFAESPCVAHESLVCIANTYHVANHTRLSSAFERWENSAACARARAAQKRFAEYPFAVQVGKTGKTLEGVIDLLCVEQGGERAYVVDYKTGGSSHETAQQLHEKHGLQACCYAYALLQQGFVSVDMDFVRVEQDASQGTDSLQSVPFHFAQSDLPRIQEHIAAQLQLQTA